MADLVVGLSKTAVQLLADKVKSAIKEEAEQWKTVQRDLVFITGEFEMMQSFLDTASEEHVRNRIVRTWVRQVRDLSHDVEDNIDFVLHLDPTKQSSWWVRLARSCARACWEVPPLPVDEAVAETTLLRARVLDVSQRNIRYNLIGDSGSGSTTNLIINAAKMQRGHSDLVKMINNAADENLEVISVCGTGGDFGKTSIIKNAYEDSVVSENFRCRAWVKLTHSFNTLEIIKNFMSQFYTNSCEEQGGTSIGINVLKMTDVAQGDLIYEFIETVNKYRYLIILEDISTMVQWYAIRSYLPDRKNGSRIILSTQEFEIASLCTGQPNRMLELCQLSPEHSVCIFFKEGLQHDYDCMRHDYNYDSLCNVYGRDTEVNELSDQIQEGRLVSVYGMPGVGKSVMVRCVYHKHKKSYKLMKHAWINVCHPFNPTNFVRTLLMDITSIPEANDPIQKCRHLLHEYKCLIVIDGLQSKEDWDWIKSNLILHGYSGSCIVIITSDERVAKHCAVSPTDTVYNVQGLDPDAAKKLFIRGLKAEEYNNVPDKEVDLILSKCGGYPRVLTTVARYLGNKPRDMFQQEMRRLSNNFMQELSTNAEFESLRDLLACMHYLYSYPRHLKKFMLYLSIFPHDIIIRRRRLIRRWIAEGYSEGTDSNSTEKYVEKIFDEFVALSIMQPVLQKATKKVIGYRVNSFFLEYILSRPAEETFFFPVQVSALEKQGHGHQVTGIGQHLAIGMTMEKDQVLFESLDLSRLRSMTLFDSMFWSFYVSDRMRVLRVLDLENSSHVDDSDFEEIGKLPSRLKFLSLRGQRRLTRLPDPVGYLVQLQTLDIRGTNIRTLPPFITKLRKLQYIRAGTTIAWTDDGISSSDGAEEGSTPSSGRLCTLSFCLPNKFLRRGGPIVGSRSGGVEVPRGIKRLKGLQTLGAVHVNTADGEAILDEISFLSQLKKLEVSGISRKQGRWSLHCIATSLRSLKMMGPVDQLPRRIEDAVNLGKLTLEMTNALLKAEVLQQLGDLPSLHTLRLRVSNDVQDGKLWFPIALFSKLQVLEIACKSKLDVIFGNEGMEKLEQLKLHCLEGSDMQFYGLEYPVSLKQVWLLGSFDDTLKAALQQQLDRHLKIPAPKLMEVQRKDNDDA